MSATAKTVSPSKSSSTSRTTSRSNALAIQARLSVAHSNDHHEQEADRVADHVVNQSAQSANPTALTSIAATRTTPTISRLAETHTQRKKQTAKEEEKEKKSVTKGKLQRKKQAIKEEEKEKQKAKPQSKLQRKKAIGNEEEKKKKKEPIQTKKQARANIRDKRQYPVLNRVEKKLFEKKGKGEKLDDDTRTTMEVGMGADFRDVNIHKDADAENMNRELRAQAFTHGKDVFFNSGKFEPETSKGKQLLAHELTHVVQQGAAEQKVPEATIDNNNAKRLQPPPEPTDKKALETKKQATLKIEQHKTQKEAATTTANQASSEAKAAKAAAEPATDKEATPQEEGTKGKPAKKAKQPSKKSSRKKASKKKAGKQKKGSITGKISQYLKKVTQSVFAGKNKKITKLAENEKKKQPAANKLKQSEKAVVPPAEESQSRAKASQVETVEGSEAPQPKEAEAKQQFNEKLQNAVPSTLEEVDKFKEEGKGRVVGEAVKTVVTQDTQAVQSTYQNIENTPEPQPTASAESLPEVETAPETPALNMGKGVVGKVLPEHTDMSQFEAESDQALKKEGISEEQLEMVDEGELAEAKTERKTVKAKAKDNPNKVKQFEQKQQQDVDKELQKEEQINKQKMRAKRQKALLGAQGDQKKTKSKLELKRQKVTEHINGIYQKANDTVKQKLEDLEKQALKAFDDGEKQATQDFENNVERRINAFKRRRYDRIGGSLLWAKDKLFGMDDLPEVKQIFDSEKARFITRIDALVKKISAENKRVIQECKTIVATARKQIEKYVAGLGPELQKTGQSALKDIKGKLDALDKDINNKQKQLQQKLAEKREAAIKAIEEKIEKMKEEMSGLVSKLGNLLLNAMVKFFKWALKKAGYASDKLMGIINKGKTVIKKIVTDPIAFIGNIVTAVKNGIGLFSKNIKKHLVSGLIGWLTGAMSNLPIQMPAQFNLKGILSLVLQILGLTWQRIRVKLVKRLGERTVKIAETSVNIVKRLITEGPMALWQMIKEKASEIKQQVMEGIRNWVIVNVIKQGIIKLLSFLNPAGAIVQAILAIYNTVMFFVENWQRIVAFVKSVFDSIGNIAMGRLSAASALIERTLGMTIPIIMNFLARLLGLSGIGKAVSKVIKKIRKPIDKIVNKVIDKIVKMARKLLKKGKGAAKAVKDKLVKWWKARKTFKANDGKTHSLYFKGEGSSAVLTIASDPTPFTSFISSVKVKTDAQKQAKPKALTIANQIDVKKREKVAGNTDNAKKANQKKKEEAVQKLLNKLSKHAKVLFGVNTKDLPATKKDFKSANKGGALMGTKMTAPILTKKGSGGSVPTSSKHAVFDKLLQRRHGGSSYYIRGHLLNHNTHGPGQWQNMTPLSKEGNRLHESVAESKVKAAVRSGAIVSYTVTPMYTRGALRTPRDADDKIKEIRQVEKFVPKSLKVVANIMHGDKPTKKKQSLVASQEIDNPVDTSIGSYQLDSAAKENVVLANDSISKIAANTSLTTEQATIIKQTIREIGKKNLTYYQQLVDKNPSLNEEVNDLRNNKRVKLK